MEATILDFMGDDQTVVNAARCSFGKRKLAKEFKQVGSKQIAVVDTGDQKLIKYLAKHGHWTPFGHCSVQFHIKAPMFVARQLGKHQVGLVWNEISRRYVDTEPEFFEPSEWRLRAKNVKQGSSDEIIKLNNADHTQSCLGNYKHLLELGVAPEMARMVLPQNTMTEWFWSGTLFAFARICKLRLAKDTQKETRDIAQMISDHCEKIFPVSWAALIEN
jgi:thymidylate synthase (FAD)